LLLREDIDDLQAPPSVEGSVHLLPHFDVYLLAHSTKEHLLDLKNYKRVYRNQGWISPVVLVNGEIAGVWSYEMSRQQIKIVVELFARASKSVRTHIEERANALGQLFQRTPLLSFKA